MCFVIAACERVLAVVVLDEGPPLMFCVPQDAVFPRWQAAKVFMLEIAPGQVAGHALAV